MRYTWGVKPSPARVVSLHFTSQTYMKLHLPVRLRSSLLTCLACVAAFSGQAWAVDITESTTVTADSFQGNADITIITPAGAATPTNVDVTNAGDSNADGFTKGNVTIGPNATLTLSANDALGYNVATATSSITMKGDATYTANLVVNQHTTLTTDLYLQGNTLISGDSDGDLDIFDGNSISATNSNNTISAWIRLRKQLTIDVGGETGITDTLTMSGKFDKSSNGGDDKTTTKTGVGSLIFDNRTTQASQDLVRGLDVQGGSVSNLGTLTIQGSGLKLANGSSFSNSGTLTISAGSLTIAGGGGTIDVVDADTSDQNYPTTTITVSTTLTDMLTKEGAGKLAFHANISGGGGIHIKEGEVQLGSSNNTHKTITLQTGDITLDAGTKLWVQHQGNTSVTNADGDLANLTLNDATLYSQNTDNLLKWGTLTSTGASHIDFYYKSNLEFAKLTGSGTLAFNAQNSGYAENPALTMIVEIENFNGSITQTIAEKNASHTLIINGATQNSTSVATIEGASKSDADFTLSGGGSLAFSTHTAEHNFTVEDGTLTAGELVLTGEGKTFSLISGTFGVGTDLSTDRSTTLGEVTLGTSDRHAAITLGGNVDFVGTVKNTGSLSLTGSTLTVSKYLVLDTTGASFSDAENENGFETATFWLVKNSADHTDTTPSLTVTATQATVHGLADPVNVTTDGNGTYFTTTDTTYHINKGTVTYGTVTGAATNAGITLTGVSLNGGILSVASAENVGVEVLVTKDATINGAATSASDQAPNHAGISGDIIAEGEGGDLTINSSGKTSSTNTHGNFFALAGNIDLGDHNLIIGDGVVRLGNINQGSSDNNSIIKVGSIVVKTGATLEIFRNGGELGTDINLQGGTIRVQQVNDSGSSALALGVLTVESIKNATSSLSRWNYGKGISFSNLTGAGDLEMAAGTLDDGIKTTFAKADGYTGTLLIKGGSTQFTDVGTFRGSITVSGGKVSFANAAGFAGDISVSDGTLAFANASTINKKLTVNGGTVSGNVTIGSEGTMTLNKVDSHTGTITLGGGVLSLGENQTYTSNKQVTLSSSSTLNLEAGAQFTAANVSGLTADRTLTLTGTGSYTIDNGALTANAPTGLNLKDPSWKGTLVVSGGGTADRFDGIKLMECGTVNSTIQLQGLVCWLFPSVQEDGTTNGSVASHVIFAKTEGNDSLAAVEITDGYSNSTLNFTGKVSGEGEFLRSWSKDNDTQGKLTYTFSGDVSEWDGQFRVKDSVAHGDTTLKFEDKATDIDVALKTDDTDGASLFVEINNDKAVSFDSAVTGKVNITYNNSDTTTVTNKGSDYAGTTTISQGSVVLQDGVKLGRGAVSVNGGKLILNDGAMVQSVVKAGTVAEIANGATYSDTTVTSSALTGGSLSDATVTVSGEFAVNGVAISSSTLNINGALTLDAASTLTATKLAVGESGILDGSGSLVLSGDDHTLALAAALAAEDVILNDLTYNNLASVQLSGLSSSSDATITVDFAAGVLEGVNTAKGIAFTFQAPAAPAADPEPGTPTPSGLTFQLSKNAVASLVAAGYAEADIVNNATASFDAGKMTVYIASASTAPTDAVPEPATATLSLLALAALAARRRRK